MKKKHQSEDRFVRRMYKTLYGKGRVKEDKSTIYLDVTGEEFEYKWLARISTFFKVVTGCVCNGFPVVVPKLWYNAWACWPFFFVRKDISDLTVIVHERIHVRQQWDIHVSVSLPLLLFNMFMEAHGWNPYWIICIVPFIPTIFYAVAMVTSFRNLISREEPISFKSVRANTCFEREARSKQLNADYLRERKFWAVLAYTRIPMFRKYL